MQINQHLVSCIFFSQATAHQAIDTICGKKPLGSGCECDYNSVIYEELDKAGGHESHDATSVIAWRSWSTYCPFSIGRWRHFIDGYVAAFILNIAVWRHR